MTTELYNKLTDDERMQYIYEKENEIEAYQKLHYAESTLITTLQEELNDMEELHHAKRMVDNALERYTGYDQYIMKKYYPETFTKTCPDCESK